MGTTQAEAIERMEKTKPTPTQEENDKAVMGEHVDKHEPDGSPEQESGAPAAAPATDKQKEVRAKATDEAVQRMEKTKPTPTQEENDKTASGEVLETHEADGSLEQDAGATEKKDKDVKAKPAGASYETRQAKPAKKAEVANL